MRHTKCQLRMRRSLERLSTIKMTYINRGPKSERGRKKKAEIDIMSLSE